MSRLLASVFTLLLVASACSSGDSEIASDDDNEVAAQTEGSDEPTGDEATEGEPADAAPADDEPEDAAPDAADDEPADAAPADDEPADAEPADDEPADIEGFCQIVQENNTLMDDFDVSQGNILDVGAFQERTGPILAAAPEAVYDDLQAFFVFTSDFMVIFEGVDTDDQAAMTEAYAPFNEEFDLRAAEIEVSNARIGEFLQTECGITEAFGL